MHMPSLNRVILVGNLTRDPELKNIPSGACVADMGLAINERFTTKDGEKKDQTCFVDIVVWGRQAETCGEYLHKGSSVLIEGKLKYDQWEKDGQKRNKLRVQADRVVFLDSRENRAEEQDATEDDDSPAPQAEKSTTQAELGSDNVPF